MATEDNMPSLMKLRDDLKAFKQLAFFFSSSQKKQAEELETQLNHMVEQINLFNARFAGYGWCAYDSINLELLENANTAYEQNGLDAAEEVLTEYYKDAAARILHCLQGKAKEFAIRYDLIKKAFEDHMAGRYHASIPVFLIIIDGAVNDFTKSKGFFAEGTDVSAWDCLVGSDDGLLRTKEIICKGRNTTNTEQITIPYRNGILHGRDLNYDNESVSCKCVALMFAVADWMSLKRSEPERMAKLSKEMKPVSLAESFAKLQKAREDRKEIAKWKKRSVVVGRDIPHEGSVEDYREYPYITPVFQMKAAWEKQNYGELSVILKNVCGAHLADKRRAGECRQLFDGKILQALSLTEVEERGCSMSKIVVRAQWDANGHVYDEKLTFGCLYKSKADENDLAYPWNDDGYWELTPWDIHGLYRV